MKKYMKVMVMVVALLCSFSSDMRCEAAKKVVAVPEVVNSCGSSYGRLAAQELESQLTTVLVQSGNYAVVERSQLSKVLNEIGLQNTGMIVGDTAIQFGQLVGAEYTIVGNVIGADVAKFSKFLYGGIKAKVKFHFKFIDNKTGQIKIAEVIEGSKTVSEFEDSSADREMLLSGAVGEVSHKIIDCIEKINPVIGTVVEISGDTVYIDMGTEKGVREGAKYVIYREGKIIKHPVTGEILGATEESIGEMEITDAKPNYSAGVVKKSERAIKRGDKVKRGKTK